MKTTYLFPHRLKLVSGILFAVAFILLSVICITGTSALDINATVFAVADNGLFHDFVVFDWTENSITDELLMLIAIPSGIVYAFCKEKKEDEMVAAIRLQSLARATIINYSIVLLGYLFIYGICFIYVMMTAMVSQLLIFIILFRYTIYRFHKTALYEE